MLSLDTLLAPRLVVTLESFLLEELNHKNSAARYATPIKLHSASNTDAALLRLRASTYFMSYSAHNNAHNIRRFRRRDFYGNFV